MFQFLNLYQPEFSDPPNPESAKVPAGADYSAPDTWGYQSEHESVRHTCAKHMMPAEVNCGVVHDCAGFTH